VAVWLEQAGLEVEIDEPMPGRPNVIGIVRGTGGGRSLMLNAHMDTVGVVGMERPHEPSIVGNRLYGRGAFDMKGGLAAIMFAAAAAKKRSLRGNVILTAVSDEEFASIGTRHVVAGLAPAMAKRWYADAAIVTEPTDLQISIAHKGFLWLDVEAQGVAAHGSRPDLGVDAIVKMGKVLIGLEELDRSLRSTPSHRLLGSGSVHASLIAGGQELSSYPERCSLSVERRTIPGETQEKVEAEIQEIFETVRASDPDFKASVKTTLVREPFEIAEDERIVQVVRRQASSVLGREPAYVGGPGWMDSAILSAAGIPTVIFGPGGEGAHAVVEWVDLEQVEQCFEVLVGAIEEFCG
jgi:acetylornithine deacetylase